MRPFVMNLTHKAPEGYVPYPQHVRYDARSQTSDILAEMGSSSPTTYSQIGSTGVISTDTDQGQDDEGKD